jgi:hypothetical protein
MFKSPRPLRFPSSPGNPEPSGPVRARFLSSATQTFFFPEKAERTGTPAPFPRVVGPQGIGRARCVRRHARRRGGRDAFLARRGALLSRRASACP